MAFIGVVINIIALSVGGSNPVTIISLIAAIWAATGVALGRVFNNRSVDQEQSDLADLMSGDFSPN